MREISARINHHVDQQILKNLDLDLSLEKSNLNNINIEYLLKLDQQLSHIRIMLEKANIRGKKEQKNRKNEVEVLAVEDSKEVQRVENGLVESRKKKLEENNRENCRKTITGGRLIV